MINLLAILLLMFCTGATAQQALVDPTRPYDRNHDAPVEHKQGLKLAADMQVKVTAIFISEQNKHTIINGKSYSEGQVVLGNKIISIEHHRVVLRDGDGSKEFFINNNNVKKDTTHGF